jgi:antitoxin VapB
MMALHIASDRVDRLARELASVTGERLTTAVERALEQRLERVRATVVDPERAERVALLRETVTRCREAVLTSGVQPPTKEEYDAFWEV